MAGVSAPNRVSRRSFLKYASLGGLAAFGAYSGIVYPTGWQRWLTWGRKPWEVDLAVVDYDRVLAAGWGPSELGFDNDIRDSPLEQRTLNVAQWYDYWPGNVVDGFASWMAQKWGVTDVEIRWQSNIYTSNEELFTWVTQTGRKFDVMFPTNYTVETMEKAGIIVNLKKEWIPNILNIFGDIPTSFPAGFRTQRDEYGYWDPGPDRELNTPDDVWIPTKPTYPGLGDEYGTGHNNRFGVDFRDPNVNGYQYRMHAATYPSPRGTDFFTWDEDNSLIAVPYQWGTTGIGYRTDVFRKEDVERMGWDVFELPTYTNPDRIDPETNQPMVFDLRKKKMMLDDMRETFTAALKAVGWKRQEEAGIPPTATPLKPEAPYNGEYQWSNNEVANEKLSAALAWLNSFRGGSWGFNTPQQGPWLVSGQIYVDQAWSGDIMYAVQPNSNTFNSVDYFVPKQGGARWIDNSVIHRECEKLWLAHELINYIHDPIVQAAISSWNLYATPNAWTFELLYRDPAYIFEGIYPDGRRYEYNMAEDERIYGDIAYDDDVQDAPYDGPPILTRCEYQKDVGVRNTLNYFRYWRKAKF